MDIYLDFAATTPLDPDALNAMAPYFAETFANPSSVHRAGQLSRKAVEEAREEVAAAIGASPGEVVFTSGATEAVNQALRSVFAVSGKGHLLTSGIEHPATLQTARWLERQGTAVTFLSPDRNGLIAAEAVRDAMRGDTTLVALMLVNNETGVRTDLPAVAEAARDRGALVFCDAVQALGVEELDVAELGVDLLALSAHKAYGPKGVGALYLRRGLELPPLLLGGGQERGRRPGTLAVPAIVGFGVAAAKAAASVPSEAARLEVLRARFESSLLRLPGVAVNGGAAPRSPKVSNLHVRGADGEALLMNLDALGVFASAGSACSAGSLEPSHVLTAMGLTPAEAKASIRFSFGRGLSLADMEEAAVRVSEAVSRSRGGPSS